MIEKNVAVTFDILYQDEYLVAIHKPSGFMVHRSSLDPYTSDLVLQHLRKQIKQRVYPIHRLDRKTSGVLLIALSKESLAKMNEIFKERKIEKEYLAICRGYTDQEFYIDYPLTSTSGKSQDAQTEGFTLAKSELPWQTSKFPTSRYSLVKLSPITGRTHQLRKHMAHIFHPILGDRPHGCNKQNRYFKTNHGMTKMMLHAYSLKFIHPFTNKQIRLQSEPPKHFTNVLDLLNLTYSSFK